MSRLPQGAQAECAFFASYTVVRLGDVVPVHETLDGGIVTNSGLIGYRREQTFDVKPPLSGLFRTALRVLKNLGSDGFIKNTSGIIMTLESSTSVSSYDCPKICRPLFHALCMICS